MTPFLKWSASDCFFLCSNIEISNNIYSELNGGTNFKKNWVGVCMHPHIFKDASKLFFN